MSLISTSIVLVGLLGQVSQVPSRVGPIPKQRSFAVKDYSRKTIYHSPRTPGYTCWVGCWAMPDKSIMVCFTQATGPVDGRPPAPKEVREKLSWPPRGKPNYDMTGLEMRNVHLRSWDGGETWKKVSADPYTSCTNGCTGPMETALPDGTVLRGVLGHFLTGEPKVPPTGFVQRSRDGTKTWGPPEMLLDPKKCLARPKRFRMLSDGRLMMVGSYINVPADQWRRAGYAGKLAPVHILMLSEDGETWGEPIRVLPQEHRTDRWTEEYDAAELPNGDLLCVFRRLNPDKKIKGEVRWQGLLEKRGKTWVPTKKFGPAPFPHSGHPELLATREGVVLHVATTGIHWTGDAGESWHRLDVRGSGYYPRSVQADDGRIHVFGHVGGDDPYGKRDQSIIMDTFRLAAAGAANE